MMQQTVTRQDLVEGLREAEQFMEVIQAVRKLQVNSDWKLFADHIYGPVLDESLQQLSAKSKAERNQAVIKCASISELKTRISDILDAEQSTAAYIQSLTAEIHTFNEEV